MGLPGSLVCSAVALCGTVIAQSGGGYLITGVASALGSQGFSGDGGPATAAQLNYPDGVAVDAAGNLFIADTANGRIRKVSTSGIITTVAGNPPPTNLAPGEIGSQGFSGDGGPATAAQLNYPDGVAVDAAGNLFVADTNNSRIRKVSTSGIIITIAGTGRKGSGGDGGPAIGSDLYDPRGISIDAQGNVVFSDGNRIRELVSPQLGVGCQYSIDQAQQAFTPAGGSASVGVLASAATCPWLAVSYANWVTVSGGAVGSGTGLVTYSAAPNPNSASRTGTLWIAGSFLAVTQSGLTCSLNVPSNSSGGQCRYGSREGAAA
jgi:hypothetical protein